MYDEGADPVILLNDFLEIIYLIIRKKNLGNFESDLSVSDSEIDMIDAVSKNVDVKTVMMFWQFIIKGIEEMSIVSNQLLALEMIIVRLIHLKDAPNYQEILNFINNQEVPNNNDGEKAKDYLNFEKGVGKSPAEQMKNIIQTKSEPSPTKSLSAIDDAKLETVKSFDDLIKLVSKKKEIELKYDLERNVNLVKFSYGKIDISFNEKLGKNFIRNLSEKLFKWTEKRWIISLTREKGKKTYAEVNELKKKSLLEEEKAGKFYEDFKDNFPDAELIEVTKKE
jgi:DNA polymerase-3 subunit gamma/tau